MWLLGNLSVSVKVHVNPVSSLISCHSFYGSNKKINVPVVHTVLHLAGGGNIFFPKLLKTSPDIPTVYQLHSDIDILQYGWVVNKAVSNLSLLKHSHYQVLSIFVVV